MRKSSRQVRAKGKRYPVERSAVACMDLLGYGAMLHDVAFDPSHSKAQAAADRLKQFQRLAALFATKNFPAMPINDATAFFHDLTPRTNAVTYDFLSRSIEVFEKINTVELSHKHPGARMVVAVGPRIRITGVATGDIDHKKSILKRVQDKIITAEQGIHEAFVVARLPDSFRSYRRTLLLQKRTSRIRWAAKPDLAVRIAI
jgi:hypothetical protein